MLDKILSYGSSFGTFISAIAALYAIWLSIFQRRISYKPNLIVKDILIETKTNKFNSFVFDNDETLQISPVELNNIGLGAAISLRYRWEYDINREMDNYNKLFFEKFKENDNSFKLINKKGLISFEVGKSSYHYPGLNLVSDIDFVLPYSTKKESTSIHFPYIATVLLVNINYLVILNRQSYKQIINGPTLIVEFQDLEGKTIRNEWKSNLQLGQSSHSSTNDVESKCSLRFSPSPSRGTLRRLEKIRKSYVDFMNEHDFNKNR